MSGRIRIDCDTDEVDRDLDRIVRGPDWFAHLAFDQILSQQFGQTQMVIHVVTGSLKISGDQHSEARFQGGWEGEISYGGDFTPPSSIRNPRNPGMYAEFEFERGGAHDWIRTAGLHEDDEDYAQAIADWMHGGPQ